jgi:hypothetical protein
MDIEPTRRRRGGSRSGSVVFGGLILLFGLTLLAGNLGLADSRQLIRQFWPVALVVFGIVNLLTCRQGQQRQGFWGFALIFAGLWAYASQHDWIRVNFWAVTGPTLLVLLGGSVVWRAFNHTRPPTEDTDSYLNSFAILSGTELRPTSTPLKGADLNAVLGGVKLDLTGAQVEGDTLAVYVFTVMGGIEIIAPRDWSVSTKVTTILSACVDQRRPAATPMPAPKTLVVHGFAFMGGIEIKD